MSLTHFKDVYLSMNWADSRIWQSVLASSEGNLDEFVLDTLIHIHETQHSFLNVWLKRPLERWKRTDFDSNAKLCSWAESFHLQVSDYLESLSSADLTITMVLPWAKYFEKALGQQPVETTLSETIHQVASHSMHHRGQVARRLRELGEVPPFTDYIVWLWMGRPAPEWPA
jgi:uncharacterized damage-inducible protein DinB